VEEVMTKKGPAGRFASKKIFYVGEKYYHIKRTFSIEEVAREHLKRARVIVLGKKFYFETSTKFPFSNMKDVKSAIRIDMSSYSPFKTDRFFIKRIGKKNGEVTLNLWFIEEGIYKILSPLSPLIIIPETALLPFLNRGKGLFYKINRENEELLAYSGANGMVKSISGGIGKINIRNFKRSMGPDAKDIPEKDIRSPEEYFTLFPSLISEISIKNLFYFANTDLFSIWLKKKYLKIGLVSMAIIVLLYGGALGIFLNYTKNELKKEDKRLSSSLSELLKTQEKTDYYYKIQRELTSKINSYVPKLPLLNIINDILPEKTIIRHLSVSGNVVQIKGIAIKGSDLLSVLSKTRGITEACFTSPVREDRKTGMESFAIRFSYDKN
jgi:hypothetical protein